MYHHLFALNDCLLVDIAHDSLIVEVVSNGSEGTSNHSISVFSLRSAILNLVFYGLDDLVLQRSLVMLIRTLKVLIVVGGWVLCQLFSIVGVYLP